MKLRPTALLPCFHWTCQHSHILDTAVELNGLICLLAKKSSLSSKSWASWLCNHINKNRCMNTVLCCRPYYLYFSFLPAPLSANLTKAPWELWLDLINKNTICVEIILLISSCIFRLHAVMLIPNTTPKTLKNNPKSEKCLIWSADCNWSFLWGLPWFPWRNTQRLWQSTSVGALMMSQSLKLSPQGRTRSCSWGSDIPENMYCCSQMQGESSTQQEEITCHVTSAKRNGIMHRKSMNKSSVTAGQGHVEAHMY